MTQGAGIQNAIVFGDNLELTGVTPNPLTSGLLTDNQFWLGSTALNAGGTHINVWKLTAGTGIAFDKTTPGVFKINNSLAGTDLHTARYIVSPGGAADGANYTTIASAYAAAVGATGKQTVFVQPGTYTENITLSAGVNITAFPGDGISTNPQSGASNVIINGKITAGYTGAVTLSGISLQTNSDFCLLINGTNATVLNLVDCNIYALNNTAISYTNANAFVYLYYCKGDTGTTGISFFTKTASGGKFKFYNCVFENNAASSTACTVTGAGLDINNSFFAIPISDTASLNSNIENSAVSNFTSGLASGVSANNSQFGIYISTGTGTSNFNNCSFNGSSSSAISIGSGCTATVADCVVSSSNTNAITGGGTLNIGGTIFTGTSSTVNTTTVVGLPLSLVQGGTNAALTASNGGIFYSTATAGAILPGTATAGRNLQSGSSTTPAWTTATYPAASVGSGKILYDNGTNFVTSTPTFPASASATTRKIIVSDGTNWLASTETYAVPGSSGNVMKSDGTNWTSATPQSSGASWILISQQTASGVASVAFTLNASYTVYKLIMRDVTIATGSATIQIQFSTDGGSTFVTTNNQSNLFIISNGATTWSQVGSASGYLLARQTATQGFNGEVLISGVEESNTPQVVGSTSHANQLQLIQGGYTSTAFTANAFKILTSSGNMSGTFTLYGIIGA